MPPALKSSLAIMIISVSGQFTEVAKAVMDGDWKSNTLWGREQKQLNCGQIDSMKLTLERKFQLIQGPPGYKLQ